MDPWPFFSVIQFTQQQEEEGRERKTYERGGKSSSSRIFPRGMVNIDEQNQTNKLMEGCYEVEWRVN